MTDAVDQGVLDRRQQPRRHLGLVIAEGSVHAGDHPVERSQQLVGVVERAVGADVHLGAGQQPESAPALVPLADLADPLPEPLLGDVVTETVTGRVVGYRHVGVAAGATGFRHLLQRVASVGERRVAVKLAADIAELDKLRERALAGSAQLAAGLAQLRFDVGITETFIDLRLGCAERRPRRSSASVIPCSETDRPLATASSRSSTLCAADPVKCWSRLPKASGATIRRSTETPLWVWARTPFGPGIPAAEISGCPARWRESFSGCSAVAIRSMSLQVSAHRRTDPAISTSTAAGCDRSDSASSSAIGRTAESKRRPDGRLRLAEVLERGEDVLLDLWPKPLQLADPLRPPPRLSDPPASRHRARRTAAGPSSPPDSGPWSPRSGSGGTSPGAAARRESLRCPAG